ncbi:NmrA/HSCARG family protein [Sodalis ligni]|uniref:SDR family oxidoreductase n=1 Tax=Sodalis ligni TaxID=2697027 RepID=UPI00193FCBEC|nr:NmrA/HSCARG family protein [Sodalis ligni]QWA09014.1 NmrA/HSCARG family protein [Sodalis ligni]
MTILITGSTGIIGRQVMDNLAGQQINIRALTRTPERASFPAGIDPVKGDLTDPQSMRAAMDGVDTLFLLVSNAPDELTQAIQAVNVAREKGVKGLVYFSVIRSDKFVDVPHFTSKYTVERMIEHSGIPATILRPGYFMQNDKRQRTVLLDKGLYAMPVGEKGLSMVDVRDIGEAAAKALISRHGEQQPAPNEIYECVGPDALTGQGVAELWSQVLNKDIHYAGNNLDLFEQQMLQAGQPGWLAYDMRLMLQRYQQDGAVADAMTVQRFARLLGHSPRRYRDFCREMADGWL